MANVLERLTEGTVFQDKKKESAALVGKWEASGLLEGIEDDFKRGSMAVLLENQAKELLREANAMSAGDVQGFAAVAFPIVRRVFAGLIANDLVSVQPMSLPSGLVFFMDFKHGTDLGLANDKVRKKGESLYGDRVGSEITGGVRLDGVDGAGRYNNEKGFYNLSNGYGTARLVVGVAGSDLGSAVVDGSGFSGLGTAQKTVLGWDADLLGELEADATKVVTVYDLPVTKLKNNGVDYSSLLALQDVYSVSVESGSVASYSIPTTPEEWVKWETTASGTISNEAALPNSARLVHRLTKVVADPISGVKSLRLTFVHANSAPANFLSTKALVVQFPVKDTLKTVGDSALGALVGSQPWTLEGTTAIPEIQLKVDSFSITARTRKLKAAWTPELGQDLNAYHNLDAEVELTSILSEQIGLEIDQEILQDLIKGATGSTKYWSRRTGKFVNRDTGADLSAVGGDATYPPDFTGNVSMWYETLLETINDVSANIHRKTLRGGANFIVVSPEVANILEFTAGFRATVTHDADKGSTGAVKVGALNSKFDVVVDPYFPRNVILVGRKGASFLESGYVYAPYVPLQTTPTIFDPNDFTPRKAVMTRYGKTMVRPDMYGLVIVQDLLG